MIECPLCKGKGELNSPRDLGEVDEKRHVAKLLREQGHSFREIMRHLGYNSPSAVQYLLDEPKPRKHRRNYNRKST